MDRAYWPNKTYLEELRTMGKVPHSRLATYCGGGLGFLIAFALRQGSIKQGLTQFVTWVQHSEISSQAELLNQTQILLSEVAWSFVILAFGFLFGAWFVALLQTRFLIHFEALSLRLERLAPYSGRSIKGAGRGFMKILVGGLGLVAGGVISLLLLAQLCFSVLNMTQDRLLTLGTVMRISVLPVLVVVLGIGILTGWIFAWISFMEANRMTRKEAELGSRE